MTNRTRSCEVLVLGGGLGGVAAALSLAIRECETILSASTPWIGGQASSQGVSALDEHTFIESFGGTRRYMRFRDRIRDHYVRHQDAPNPMNDGEPLNPGNAWVSRLSFEPSVADSILRDMLEERAEHVRLIESSTIQTASVSNQAVTNVRLRTPDGTVTVEADIVIDATEWGDLLPLIDTPYVTGAEAKSDTGEAHAPPNARPDEIQGFTYCFAIEHHPGEDHTIEPPSSYERMRDSQPYTLEYEDHKGDVAQYRIFEHGPDDERPFWTYRRLLDASLLEDVERDVVLINWSGNDYHRKTPLDVSPEQRAEIFVEAKELALGFLYWLQTEVPRDDGDGHGYPGFKLIPEMMGTADGLSQHPYVRESRRIVPLTRVIEGDIARASQRGARAQRFPNAVGIGYYGLDLHSCVGNPDAVLHEPTNPFQIPLGALIPGEGPRNVLAGNKNIGTTHLTNGAYRLHPTEWAIGEAAGGIASWSLAHDIGIHHLFKRRDAVRAFQLSLLDAGSPIAWTIDCPPDHPLFAMTQLLYVEGAISHATPRGQRLTVDIDEPLTCAELHGLLAASARLTGYQGDLLTWSEPDLEADVALTRRSLETAGFRPDGLSDPPTWRDLCQIVTPAIREHLATVA